MEKKNSTIIDSAAEKKRREKSTVPTGKEIIPYTPGADAISLEEGYRIAQRIVKKYTRRGALLKDFLKRRNVSDLTSKENQELHEALLSQREMAAAYSTPDLKSILGQHSLSPDHFDGVYILAVAEEYIKRFRTNTDELPWR